MLGRALLALSLACAPMAMRQPVSDETAEHWKRLLSTDEGSPVVCWTTAISALHEHFGVSPILPDPGLDCLVCWKSHQVSCLSLLSYIPHLPYPRLPQSLAKTSLRQLPMPRS